MAAMDGIEGHAQVPGERRRRFWSGWSLSRQFATCASIVLLPAMGLIGFWVSDRIEENVTQSAATSAALYMENFVEPLVQELATIGELSKENETKLGRLLIDTSLGQRVQTFKVWKKGGVIVASSRPETVGQQFVPSSGLKQAWKGIVSASFDHLPEDEHKVERGLGIPLLELYIPIRARGSENIIAVGEFYENASTLKVELTEAKLMSWLIVAAVTLSMLAALFTIVRRGSQTIEQQRRSLEQRISELTELLAENRRLRQRAHEATVRASETTEGYLRRLGADLHDGPAQLISLALLRLDEAVQSHHGMPPASAVPNDSPRQAAGQPSFCMRTVLADALNELRLLAEGLAVPEIDKQSLREALQSVVLRHEQLTRTTVLFDCDETGEQVSSALKHCAYRFVQEGLSNAYRHAGGAGQSLKVRTEGNVLVLVLADAGAGFSPVKDKTGRGLGLRGLTSRIESLGGLLKIRSSPDTGTVLTARLPLEYGMLQDA